MTDSSDNITAADASTQFEASRSSQSAPVPAFALRSAVLFPHTSMTVKVVRSASVALFASLSVGDEVCAFYVRDPDNNDPLDVDIHAVGTLARVTHIRRGQDRGLLVTLQGLSRFRFRGLAQREPYYLVRTSELSDVDADGDEATILAQTLRKQLSSMVGDAGGAVTEALRGNASASKFCDVLAAGLGLPTEEGVALLEIAHVPSRLQKLTDLLGRAAVQNQLRTEIEGEVRKKFGKHQRKAILREQMAAIAKELDEDNEDGDDIAQLERALVKAQLPEEAQKIADAGLQRLERGQGQGPEPNVIRSHLELMAKLPWARTATSRINIAAISQQLDDDHEGLADAKQRVLEYMAVAQLSERPPPTILCLSGPPGVGKTSLARSIADSTGRPFARIALGGVRDEAELRGHRRTYVGAMPGRIIKAIERADANNPVILLDEIDKLSHAWGRSTESALLEILDPEQNAHFVDHYLEAEFDLSQVLFICTANDLQNLSAPLRDRMEVVELSGYTTAEKQQIARKHLIPRAVRRAGLAAADAEIADSTLTAIIQDYTREAGVRQLNRHLERLARNVALEVARGEGSSDQKIEFSADALRRSLGRPKFRSDRVETREHTGVATGLAWTPFGGDILFVETSRMPGTGQLMLTGQLGDVMRESARAALSYVRSHAEELSLQSLALDAHDIHIHVPAGAVPKDGPSAGVTIFTALTSLLTGRAIRTDTAMTGEATLRGRVLPVGGIKAKLLAAHRAGIKRVLIPMDNAEDLEEVPDEVLESMEVLPVEDMRDVLEAALTPIEKIEGQYPGIEAATIDQSSEPTPQA